MKKPFFHLVALVLVAMGLTACGGDSSDDEFGGEDIVEKPSEPPIEVQTYVRENNFLGPTLRIRYIKITALADSVEITEVVPNRGKCFVGGAADLQAVDVYKVLEFGQTWDLPIAGCSRLLELKVVTDKGEWEFNFQ